MIKIGKNSQIQNIEKNKIFGNPILTNAIIEFTGHDNILYLGKNIKLENVKIQFTGSNSLIYLDDNEKVLRFSARIGNDSVLYLGKNIIINKEIKLLATERKNIIIGDDCLLASSATFRTADAHLIYDIETGERINSAKSIYVGNHVWIGQQCLILKNTKIHSGSIIGGNSVLSNKSVPANTM